MQHFTPFVVWTVALSFSCFSAVPVPSSSPEELTINIGDFSIDYLRDVKCDSNMTLYTPKNVAGKCIGAAVDCFLTELSGTARLECEDDGSISEAVASLRRLVPFTRDSLECHCVSWPETPFNVFLDEMTTLLEQMKTAAET